MRFIFDGKVWAPTDGAIVPSIIDKGADAVKEAATNVILGYIHDLGIWLSTYGLSIAAELALIWGLVCVMMAITGTGKWLERGAKSLLISIMLGVVRYAI